MLPIAPSPSLGRVRLSACTCQAPQLLSCPPFTQLVGPAKLAKDQIPGGVREADFHGKPHLRPALHSLQSPPTPTLTGTPCSNTGQSDMVVLCSGGKTSLSKQRNFHAQRHWLQSGGVGAESPELSGCLHKLSPPPRDPDLALSHNTKASMNKPFLSFFLFLHLE